MGCEYCRSGLGEMCQGPLGIDDLEVDCDCDCHRCPDCHSAYCVKMGGADPCESDEDDYEREAEVDGKDEDP